VRGALFRGRGAHLPAGGVLLLLTAALVAGGLAGAPGPDGRAPAPAPARVAAASVVRVIAAYETGPAELATGFEPRPGRVITVAHVVDDGAELAVSSAGGGRRRARVLRIDRRDDLALLAVDDGPASPGGVRDPAADSTCVRDAASVCGGPRLLVRRSGEVRAVPVEVRRRLRARVHSPAEGTSYRRPALDLAVGVRVGDSGAPLVGAHGRVLGIVFARSRTRTGRAYAVDGAAIPALLDDEVAARPADR
jgi:S1-C subfamily serine protease